MASDVDICNLALAHLGDAADVASIDPPEGSAQADHCARWYPIARDQLLEKHTWSFATKRVQLAQLGNAWPEWQYIYAVPDDCLRVFAVLPPNATDDYSVGLPLPRPTTYDYFDAPTQQYVPQDFVTEADADTGDVILYTNVPQAVGRYIARVTDTTKFSPLFVQALSRLLASYLAGPVIKGQEGMQVATGQYRAFLLALSEAITADSNTRQVKPRHVVSWVARR
jgi:hypothetical protein